jgi:hypothetical protein
MKAFSLLSVLLAASAASAHTIFQQIGINGAMQTRLSPSAFPRLSSLNN